MSNNENISASNDNIIFENSIFDINVLDVTRLSDYVEDVVSYIAGWVVRKILPRIKCNDCREALISTAATKDHCLLLELRNRGGLYHPSRDVVIIARRTEKAIRHFLGGTMATTNNVHYAEIEKTVLQSLPSHLFSDYENHFLDSLYDISSHYISLSKCICRAYINVRLHHMARLTNSTDRQSIRQKLTHTILFLNQ
jgi:hypothetical protein